MLFIKMFSFIILLLLLLFIILHLTTGPPFSTKPSPHHRPAPSPSWPTLQSSPNNKSNSLEISQTSSQPNITTKKLTDNTQITTHNWRPTAPTNPQQPNPSWATAPTNPQPSKPANLTHPTILDLCLLLTRDSQAKNWICCFKKQLGCMQSSAPDEAHRKTTLIVTKWVSRSTQQLLYQANLP